MAKVIPPLHEIKFYSKEVDGDNPAQLSDTYVGSYGDKIKVYYNKRFRFAKNVTVDQACQIILPINKYLSDIKVAQFLNICIKSSRWIKIGH